MTSQRRRKRAAQQQGLNEAELQLAELLREVLSALRWSQVLGWGNQYLVQQHLQISPEERDRVMRAAAETVDRDGQLQQWQQRLATIEERLRAIDGALRPRRAPRDEPRDEQGGDGAEAASDA